MKKEILKVPTSYFDSSAPVLKPPPIIPPPPKQEVEKQKPRQAQGPASSTVFLLRVTPEYRLKGRSRLTLTVVADNDRNAMPSLKLRPGMHVKLTIIPSTPKPSGGNDAKE